MKFIHFIDEKLEEKVLKEGILLSPNQREINEHSTGIFCYPLIKTSFKIPVKKDDYDHDDIQGYLDFKKEEKLLNESLSIEEAWEVVDGLRVKKRDENVQRIKGIIFELEAEHWPITVFINIRHFIANEFAQILHENPNSGIEFLGYKNSLLALIKRIESEKYVIASAPFKVSTESDLLDLINKFQNAGGGIWKGDSFECMLITKVASGLIEKTVEVKNRYYPSATKK